MDMQLTYRGVCVDEPLYNDSVEQAIDCEFTLPDYCPDIQKILKCTAAAAVAQLAQTQMEHASIKILKIVNL